MTKMMEALYHNWIGPPRPEFWPEHVAHDPVLAHGLDCFERGLQLGLLLWLEAFLFEMDD